MPITLDGTNGITTPTYGGADAAEYLVPVTAFKNRIINGAMVINQRGFSGNPSNEYTLDRWKCGTSQSAKFSVSQNAGSVTPPAGFRNYLGATSLSAYSITSTDIFNIFQIIEGFNTADLMWGTANAQAITVSFWVRSSLTGTFGGALRNDSANRSYPFTYTISSANTWEQKSVTIAGDTTGTWDTTNGGGIYLYFSLGTGSTYSGTAGAWAASDFRSATGATSVVGTNGATFYLTGVQLEVGSTATSFDYRPYGTELQLCQRYYYQRTYSTAINSQIGIAQAYTSSNSFGAWIQITNEFRANPTLTRYPAPSDLTIANSGASGALGTSSGSYTPAATNYGVYWDVARSGGGLSAGNAVAISAQNNCTFGLSAEL